MHKTNVFYSYSKIIIKCYIKSWYIALVIMIKKKAGDDFQSIEN